MSITPERLDELSDQVIFDHLDKTGLAPTNHEFARVLLAAVEAELTPVAWEWIAATNELKADAERYRWLRDNCQETGNYGDIAIRFNCDYENFNDIDRSIDNAMRKQQ